MASGRINRNVPCRAGGLGGNTSTVTRGRDRYRLESSSTTPPIGCHRTTRANIRSHLYGGPQGWNPHFLRTRKLPGKGIKPFEPGSFEVRCGRALNGPDQTTFAFIPNTLLHLRASDSPSPEPTGVRAFASHPNTLLHLRASDRPEPDRAGRERVCSHPNALVRLRASDAVWPSGAGVRPAPLRISFDGRVLLKAVEPAPLRHAITWVNFVKNSPVSNSRGTPTKSSLVKKRG